MIAYNVTVKIDHSVHDEWLQWMKGVHIPDVLKTELFVNHKMFRILEQDESDGITYAIQYFANNMSDYFEYKEKHAVALQNDHNKKFKDNFVAFRTILKVIE